MTYIKIINNYIWDGLIRNLTRQLANRTKNDNVAHENEEALVAFWTNLYHNEMSKLKEALSTSTASEEQMITIINRFESTYRDNYYDAKIIWGRMHNK